MVPNLQSTEITTTLISSIAKIPKVAILHKRWVKKSKATRTSTNGVNNLTAPYLHVQDSRGAGASDVSSYIAESKDRSNKDSGLDPADQQASCPATRKRTTSRTMTHPSQRSIIIWQEEEEQEEQEQEKGHVDNETEIKPHTHRLNTSLKKTDDNNCYFKNQSDELLFLIFFFFFKEQPIN